MTYSDWYVSAMQRLVVVVQELSQANNVEAITALVREAARSLTAADGATFVLRDGDQCFYVEENAIGPLWKGRRFPMQSCISGWTMLNAQPAVIEDIYQDDRIPHDAYRPTFVKSLVMVPIRRMSPIGAIGNYWASKHLPTEEEVSILQALADTTSVALENARLYGDLQQQVRTLEAQEARILAQRDSLEVFTRAMAHDLKEPVRTIRSFTDLIDTHRESPQKTQEYFRFIQKAADRMGMLIDTVFRYTQLDDPLLMTKKSCSMTNALSTVRENLSLLIRDQNAIVRGTELPTVEANPVQMEQLMQNLVANAVRHIHAPVSVWISAKPQADHWLFAVSDDGPGIAAEFLESIFEPFKRLIRRDDCSGLGLAVCRKIVEAHGGKIWCESAPGKGATFFFTLPRMATAEIAQEPAGESAQTSDIAVEGKLANVLLVDDREDDVELTRLMLFDILGLDCNLSVAFDAEESLKMLAAAQSKGEPFDLLLLDINMPGMNGFELMEHLRQVDSIRHIPIVMCTGSTYEKDKQRAEALGAAGYLEKPPQLERLKQIIKQITTISIQYDGQFQRLIQVSTRGHHQDSVLAAKS